MQSSIFPVRGGNTHLCIVCVGTIDMRFIPNPPLQDRPNYDMYMADETNKHTEYAYV